MKYFSMFSGIGGFENGINKIIKNAECVGYSEIDKYASSIYKYHYPEHKNFGDATKINPDEIPDFDLLVGGFPCQAFSIAGKRRGFEDTRGTLFFEIARILKRKQPRMFLLENVKGLLNHDKGETFTTILKTIDELGYDAEWEVLNSKNFGVPQNRERVFIVGHLRGQRTRQVFPIGQGNGENIELQRQQAITNTIKARHLADANGSYIIEREQLSQEIIQLNNPKHSNKIKVAGMLSDNGWEKRHENTRRVYDVSGICPTIPTAQGGGVMTKIAIPIIHNTLTGAIGRQGSSKEYIESLKKVTEALKVKNSVELNDFKIRRLTPTECERLQAFPDGWTKYGYDESDKNYHTFESIFQLKYLKWIKKKVTHKKPTLLISDSQRYKCLGNAVTTNSVSAIIEKIIETNF